MIYNRGGNIYDKHNDELSLRKFRLSRSSSCTRMLYVHTHPVRNFIPVTSEAYESIMFPDRYRTIFMKMSHSYFPEVVNNSQFSQR